MHVYIVNNDYSRHVPGENFHPPKKKKLGVLPRNLTNDKLCKSLANAMSSFRLAD